MWYSKFKELKILVIVTVVLCLLDIPFLMFDSLDTAFNTGLNLVRTSAAVGTFTIAVLLYDKFGTNRLIKEKQISIALNILDILKTTVIFAKVPNMEMLIWISKDLSSYETRRGINSKDQNEIIDFRKRGVLYSSMQFDYINERISELVQSIYMPKSLKDEFEFLRTNPMPVVIGTHVDEEEFVIIYSKGNFSLEEIVVGYPPSGQMTFEEFLRKLENLTIKIEEWIALHTDLKEELNLDTN